MAVVAVCIAYIQLTVTQCGIFIEYAIFQNYVADFAFGCGYFAVFIYGEVVVCTIECTVTVYEERHNTVFICSTYGQVVFCVQGIGLNIVYINVFVQLNLNLSAVMAYADVLVAAEINNITGFYIGCFGCNTVGSKIPAHVSSCTYCLQLTYVYCIIVVNACCYAADFAVLVEGNLAVDYGVTILHVNRCAFTINNACSACCTIQCQLSIAVGNGGNISQIACNINLVIGLSIFNCRYNCCILTVRQGGMLKCFFVYLLQLCYVYSISVFATCCYVDDLTSYTYTTYRYSTFSRFPNRMCISRCISGQRIIALNASFSAYSRTGTKCNRTRCHCIGIAANSSSTVNICTSCHTKCSRIIT